MGTSFLSGPKGRGAEPPEGPPRRALSEAVNYGLA